MKAFLPGIGAKTGKNRKDSGVARPGWRLKGLPGRTV
ncbi:hypothetical protein HY17_12730 [Hyphomonas sp. CY54-11-8]|nr:hypothetical protein HY17_12730 [Hyphomonas sp. CY54-11-8]